MKFILIATMLLSSTVFANDCTFTIIPEKSSVQWTAYKTPLKAGVNGSFDKLNITMPDVMSSSLKDALKAINFNIDTSSVNTGNKPRDKKIYDFFFKPFMGSNKISGSFTSYKKKVVTAKLTMNKVTKDVPLKVISNKNNTLIAQGTIDVLDFSLSKSLAAINKACLELHEGKTWNDVALKVTIGYSKSCK